MPNRHRQLPGALRAEDMRDAPCRTALFAFTTIDVGGSIIITPRVLTEHKFSYPRPSFFLARQRHLIWHCLSVIGGAAAAVALAASAASQRRFLNRDYPKKVIQASFPILFVLNPLIASLRLSSFPTQPHKDRLVPAHRAYKVLLF